MLNVFQNYGRKVLAALDGAGYASIMLLRVIILLPKVIFRWRVVTNQMYVSGFQSFIVVLMFAGVSGMVLALQTGMALMQFSLEWGTGSIVTLSMVREMGPLMTAIIILGRVGASMAAELGTMSVSEEIDALETLAVDPVKFLVLPRIVALAIMTPVLTIFADAIGILGGAFVSVTQIHVDLLQYFMNSREYVTVAEVAWGLLKAFVFGITIATIACSYGMRARGGALGVGKASRDTVVTALIMVIILNYILSSIYLVFFY